MGFDLLLMRRSLNHGKTWWILTLVGIIEKIIIPTAWTTQPTSCPPSPPADDEKFDILKTYLRQFSALLNFR